MEGKTSTGFEYKIDERVLTDWRFSMALAETQTEDKLKKICATNKMIKFMLGEDGVENLTKHIASLNDGFAPMEEVMREVSEIMSQKGTKNSLSSPSA